MAETRDLTSLRAPTPPKSPAARAPSRGFWRRLGFGQRRANQSQVQILLEEVQAKLPADDPLRRARLQTQLFLDRLPAFPTPQETAPPRAPQKGPSVEMPQEESQDIQALRAEKSARAQIRTQKQQAEAQDPGRQRTAALREQHKRGRSASSRPNPRAASRSTASRAASAPRASTAVGRSSTASARAAAQRAPARRALDGPTRAERVRQGGGASGSLNAVVLLALLVTLALVAALGWYGYGWLQSLDGRRNPIASVLAPNVDPGSDSDPDVESGIPTLENPADPPIITEAALPEAATNQQPSPPTSEELEAQAYTDAVLLLERELASYNFLRGDLVDGVYTLETRVALQETADTLILNDMLVQVVAAGLSPTRGELETWYATLEPLF